MLKFCIFIVLVIRKRSYDIRLKVFGTSYIYETIARAYLMITACI